MTPQPQRVPYSYPREAAPARQLHLKGEAVKYLIAILVAGLTSYFATIYAIKEEVAVLKVHVEYLREAEKKQTAAINELTKTVRVHYAKFHPDVVAP